MAHQLTYSVRDLFTTADKARPGQPAGLADYVAQDFLIAAYQRGYKWKADGGLVENLLNTLYEAQQANQNDYYLQYLTVKQQGGARPTLEVIDGQQRLTTLTLFFGVGRATGWLKGEDFTKGKLRYDIRNDEEKGSLLDRYVYDTEALRELLGLTAGDDVLPDWETFVASQPADADRQDMYHMFEAALCIYSFGLSQLDSDLKRRSFWDYVADNARLIVNAVAAGTASETVFQNLNDNRKELTDLDLVKGLLLTRPARESSDSFRQIMELRTAQGRQWDEMAHWLAQPAVEAVFVLPARKKEEASQQPGLHLLTTLLVARDPEWASFAQRTTAGGAQRFPFYTFLRQRLTAGPGGGRRASEVLGELRLLYQVLRDWYHDPHIRNGLGVLRASVRGKKGYGREAFQELLRRLTGPELTAGAPRAAVWAEIRTLPCLALAAGASAGPTKPPGWQVSYGEDKDDIRELLLLLSVFPRQARLKEPGTFDFAAYQKEKWSLEHIFPQNPAETFHELPPADREELLKLIAADDRPTVQRLLNLGPDGRTTDQDEQLRDLLRAASQQLNGLGNLVLLDGRTNTALRNHPFAEKRRRLSEKVAQGAFVPAHTFGVFAKLVPESATDRLGVWGPKEMKQHKAYVLRERAELQQYFV